MIVYLILYSDTWRSALLLNYSNHGNSSVNITNYKHVQLCNGVDMSPSLKPLSCISMIC